MFNCFHHTVKKPILGQYDGEELRFCRMLTELFHYHPSGMIMFKVLISVNQAIFIYLRRYIYGRKDFILIRHRSEI